VSSTNWGAVPQAPIQRAAPGTVVVGFGAGTLADGAGAEFEAGGFAVVPLGAAELAPGVGALADTEGTGVDGAPEVALGALLGVAGVVGAAVGRLEALGDANVALFVGVAVADGVTDADALGGSVVSDGSPQLTRANGTTTQLALSISRNSLVWAMLTLRVNRSGRLVDAVQCRQKNEYPTAADSRMHVPHLAHVGRPGREVCSRPGRPVLAYRAHSARGGIFASTLRIRAHRMP